MGRRTGMPNSPRRSRSSSSGRKKRGGGFVWKIKEMIVIMNANIETSSSWVEEGRKKGNLCGR